MALFKRAVIAVASGAETLGIAAIPNDVGAELLRYARSLPILSPGITCHCVHVLGWPGRSRVSRKPLTHSLALRMLTDAVDRHLGGHSVTCHILHGHLMDCLLETTVELAADLILLGHRPGYLGCSLAPRSLARRLAMKAPCSVWMRPSGGPLHVHRVLAAVDFSASSALALSVATQIAQRSGSGECVALHVADVAEDQMEALHRFIAPIQTRSVEIKPMVKESGNVARAVQQVAQSLDCDLIVMGSRGQTRSSSILLGSESEHVLMESQIPVLVVKRPGERAAGLVDSLLDPDVCVPERLRVS